MNYFGKVCGGLALVLTTGGLGNVDPLRAPAAGGDAWLEYRSEHFRLMSDLPQRDALNVLAEYEHVYALLADATLHGASAPSFVTQAVVFRTAGELQPFVPANIAGVYEPHLPNEPEGEPTMLVSGTLSPFGRTLFAHELTHRFNYVALGTMSTWLNEGLAQYYSTIRGEIADPVIGESDPQHVAASGSVRGSVGDIVYHGSMLPVSSLPAASALVRMDREEFYGASFEANGPSNYDEEQKQLRNYAASWMLIHLLMHADSEYAAHFRRVLGHPDQAHTGAALDALLQAVPSARLDRDFADYLLKSIPWREKHLSPRQPPQELETRPMKDPEVLALWARLDDFAGPSAARAGKRLEQAVSADPKNAAAHFWSARYSERRELLPEAEQQYQRAIELDGSPEYRFALLRMYLSPPWRSVWADAAHGKRQNELALQLEPLAQTPQQFTLLALNALLASDAVRGDYFAKRAVTADPGCTSCLHAAAAVAYLTGEFAKAVELETRALHWLPASTSRETRAVIEHAAVAYRKAAQHPDEKPSGNAPTLLIE